jgi:type II secretory pathway component PulK
MRFQHAHTRSRSGLVLFAVLMVITVLSLAAYQYLDLMMSEARASNRILRATEARGLADSGVHYVCGILGTTDYVNSTLGNNVYDNPTSFQGQTLTTSNSAARQGRFSILSVDYTQGAGDGTGQLPTRFGLSDECAKININTLMQVDTSGKVLYDTLMRLPNMTEDVANSIVDWVDADEDSRQGGAESQYYSALTPAYRSKNAPLDSLEELLLVKGITPSILFGTDLNRNGQQDADETDSIFDAGLAPYLTVYSRERNIDAEGNQRIYLNNTSLSELNSKLVPAVGQELATFILAYRLYDVTTTSTSGTTVSSSTVSNAVSAKAVSAQVSAAASGLFTRPKRSISSLFSLISATITIPASGRTPAITIKSPLAEKTSQKELLPKLLEKCSTQNNADLPGRVNVNTAPREVLAALPGLADYVDTILEKRPQPGSTSEEIYNTPAWLVSEVGLSASTVQTIERYITAKTQVYRVQSIGYFDGPGPMVRVEAVVDANGGKPRILYYRDLSELGQTFSRELRGR